ncbi:MAG: MazG nucleotide pyrophosphohydrolase domain-containing protein [candidate division WOR-3 bacterium]
MTIDEFQKLIERLYYTKDKTRGLEGTFMWFAEEVGELSRAIRKAKHRSKKVPKELEEEFADCFAWLVTLASLTGIRLEKAIKKYADGCPKCHKIPCECREK